MLKIENLCKVFNKDTINENALFDGMDLQVKEGQFVTIIGSNGAGKSTLLNIISGTIKADEGSITLSDKNITNMVEYKCTKSIGRVFQDPSKGVAPEMTILENMSMAYNKGKGFGFSRGISKKNLGFFRELLSELNLGLEDRINTKVKLLSGGQRQALSLIMAVMSKPKLLLLDEHIAALDPKTAERIIEITDKVVKENAITTLMVTHNLNHAINIGNRLIMMHQGRIVMDVEEEEKKGLNIDKLFKCFEKLQLDKSLSDRIIFS